MEVLPKIYPFLARLFSEWRSSLTPKNRYKVILILQKWLFRIPGASRVRSSDCPFGLLKNQIGWGYGAPPLKNLVGQKKGAQLHRGIRRTPLEYCFPPAHSVITVLRAWRSVSSYFRHFVFSTDWCKHRSLSELWYLPAPLGTLPPTSSVTVCS